MVGALSFTSVALAVGLAWSLWQLVTQTRRINAVRLELRSVVEHVREVEASLSIAKNRNSGYEAIIASMRKDIIKKNELLKKHGASARPVIDGMLSDEGDSET
tara:strand:+ start:281 stop:589 length:309 start_codon:yes stop_codon:yes gene_type:complete